MNVAAQAILEIADELIVKSPDARKVVSTIEQRLANGVALSKPKVESVATILERASSSCIEDWLRQVQCDSRLNTVPLTPEQRTAHLPQLFSDLVARLRANAPLGSPGILSPAAANHGLWRRQLGYSAAMVVEESHILQVCIFHTLQKNLHVIDFSVLLLQVTTSADEVDSQLGRAMECYIAESLIDSLPG